MFRVLPRLLLLLVILTVFSRVASADQFPIGFISFDAANAALTSGQFDITNQTGPNSIPPFFPVTTPLAFGITSLTVNFVTGSPIVLHAGDFTSDTSGGWLGNNAFTTPILSAVLVGTLSPTAGVVVSGFGTTTISAAFQDGLGNPSVRLTDVTGGPLALGDVATIYAATGASTTVPEPGTSMLLATGLAGLIGSGLLLRRRRLLQGGTEPSIAA
jgi:hypothetical protein